MNMHRLATLFLAALLPLGVAQAQVPLTEFEAGTPIEADEVNTNFSNLADAIHGVEQDLVDTNARVDALESEPASKTLRISQFDVLPLESDLTFWRNKDGLILPSSNTEFTCFAGRINLPHGAEVTAFAAIIRAADGTGSGTATASFSRRAWGDSGGITMTAVDTTATQYQEEMAPTGAFPMTIDNDTYLYVMDTCVEGDGGFLEARIEYDLP